MDNSEEIKKIAWSERVEDLVDRGDVEGAVSYLQSVVSNLEILDSSTSDDLCLAAALSDLADLRSSQVSSLKADELRYRAFVLRASQASRSLDSERLEMEKAPEKEGDEEIRVSDASNGHQEDQEEEEDDWEAIADCDVPGETLLSLKQDEATLSPSQVDSSPQAAPKRRGRGSFLYQKSYLYSDQPDVGTTSINNSASDDEAEARNNSFVAEDHQVQNLKFGTSHILVIYGFPVATRTVDLEKLFNNFRDRGFAIRWVNDTTALAVFRSPSLANEAQSSICLPYKVRKLGEEDDLLVQVSTRDLEPPLPRPKTSATTAQRLIARGMGIKLSQTFGSSEPRKEEEARRKRIIARQTMKADAWGSD